GAGDVPDASATAALSACPSMEGLDLASRVSTKKSYSWGRPGARFHIVAYDYGIKRNILRIFGDNDCRVTVVPSATPARDALAVEPDGIFLANGPGDPAAIPYAQPTIKSLTESGIPS